MELKAKLVSSAVTICAALVVLFLQGCLSEISSVPPTAIGEGFQLEQESSEKEVLRQPTILRAEVAAPPTASVADEQIRLEQRPGGPDLEFRVGPESDPQAGIPAVDSHIADLLPLPSLDHPPVNQR
jgi:hypothetical protein